MTYSALCRVFLRKTLHFFNKDLLLFSALFPFLLNAQDFTSTILSQNQDNLRIKYTFTQPRLDKTDGKVSATYNKSVNVLDANGAQIPLINEFISLAGDEAQITVVSKKQHVLKIDN